jgi:hypothetical protein
MPLSFPLACHTIQNCAESGYGAVYHDLRRYRGYVHGGNRAKVRGRLAITQSCHEAGDVTLTAHDLVSSPVWNSREIQAMSA